MSALISAQRTAPHERRAAVVAQPAADDGAQRLRPRGCGGGNRLRADVGRDAHGSPFLP